jgi:hypothetical protein
VCCSAEAMAPQGAQKKEDLIQVLLKIRNGWSG